MQEQYSFTTEERNFLLGLIAKELFAFEHHFTSEMIEQEAIFKKYITCLQSIQVKLLSTVK